MSKTGMRDCKSCSRIVYQLIQKGSIYDVGKTPIWQVWPCRPCLLSGCLFLSCRFSVAAHLANEGSSVSAKCSDEWKMSWKEFIYLCFNNEPLISSYISSTFHSEGLPFFFQSPKHPSRLPSRVFVKWHFVQYADGLTILGQKPFSLQRLHLLPRLWRPIPNESTS